MWMQGWGLLWLLALLPLVRVRPGAQALAPVRVGRALPSRHRR